MLTEKQAQIFQQKLLEEATIHFYFLFDESCFYDNGIKRTYLIL